MTVIADDGWDTEASLVGPWVERRPRRTEVVRQLRVETVLLPWLAPLLPLAVPEPRILTEEPFTVRHRLVPGIPLRTPGPAQGRVLGAFLRALHAVDPGVAVGHGVPSGSDVRARRERLAPGLRSRVLPLLPAGSRDAAATLLSALPDAPAERLVHADIGPAHLLEQDGVLTGVIDFGDAHIGDPAADLAWPLYGAPQPFAEAVAATYGVSPALRQRALMWHRLAPWLEADFGLHTDAPHLVRSGLEGILRQTGA